MFKPDKMFNIPDGNSSSGSDTPKPEPAPGITRKCLRCEETHPLEAFARSYRAHGKMQRTWLECNSCTWKRKDMIEQEFKQLYRNSNEDLVIQSNLSVPFTKCDKCELSLPVRDYVRGRNPVIEATFKTKTCNECCIKNGDMRDESVVEFPSRAQGSSTEPMECVACFQVRSPEYFIRSREPHGVIQGVWKSCNHCAMRRSGLVPEVFANRYHGRPDPAERVN